jgi:CheY-like chemotaxis protein
MPPTGTSRGRSPSGARQRAPRILLVDEDDECRELFARELETDGFVVYEAANGADGIERVRECEPDVIVLDLLLREVNGITFAQVVRHLKSGGRGASILVVTSLITPGLHSLALAAGCDSILAKPASPAAVVEEVRRLVAAHDWETRSDIADSKDPRTRKARR